MMNFHSLFTVKLDCDHYSITLTKNFIEEIKKNCKDNLILSLIKFFLTLLMEIELTDIIGLNRGEHSKERQIKRNGYRTKKWKTLVGEIALAVPRLSQGCYVPFFNQALDDLRETCKNFYTFTYICGITTRYIGRLFENIGLPFVDKSEVSRNSKKFLTENEKKFNQKDLSNFDFPVIMVDALYEKVRIAFRYSKMAVIVVTGIDLNGTRHLIDIQVCFSESVHTYRRVFSRLRARGLSNPELIISDANRGIRKAVKQSFPGCVWQACSVHLIRKTLQLVKKKNKLDFLNSMRKVYQALSYQESQQAIYVLEQTWTETEGRAVHYFTNRVEETLAYHQFSKISYHKIYTTNLHERFNRSIRKRTRCSNQFPSVESYRRLVISYFEYYGTAWKENSCFTPQEMAMIKKEGELRRKKVDELLGEDSNELNPEKTNADLILLEATGVEIRNEEISQTALALIALEADESGECKAIGSTILDGSNDQEKLLPFFDSIQSSLNDHSIVLSECGQPVMENILPDYFNSNQLKYGCDNLLEEFISLTPVYLRDSILAFADDLVENESYHQSLQASNSLMTLWNDQLREATDLLSNFLPALYNAQNQHVQKTYQKALNKSENLLKSVALIIQNQNDLTRIKKDLTFALNYFNQNNRVLSTMESLKKAQANSELLKNRP